MIKRHAVKNGEITTMKDSAYYYREIEPQKMDGVKLYRVKETLWKRVGEFGEPVRVQNTLLLD